MPRSLARLSASESSHRDQFSVVFITNIAESDFWYTQAAQRARFPAPIPAKAGTMPAHKRLGPDDRHGLEDSRKPTIQLDEEQAIAIGKVNTTAHLALQHDQLMSKRGILCFKPALRLEERGNYVQQVGYQRDHSR
jgi:hypothetical protein